MKVLGIIAEYNPFHNGHLYHINKSKESTNSDFIVVAMSGNFTQQGNIAIYDKFKRANIAIKNGADLIIEIPTIYANSSSEFFTFGGILLLESLKIITYLSFGSESGDIKTLTSISNKIISNKEKIWNNISNNLKSGISFAQAREKSISEFLNDIELLNLSKPNNILGIEYLNNIFKLNSRIKPITIPRECSNFNDNYITTLNKFTSATSIRNYIHNNKNLLNLNNFVPKDTLDVITNIAPTFNEKLFNILKYKIITTQKDDLSNINEVTEGIENRIITSLSNSTNYDEFINNIKSKRYQMSKIKRMLNNILLNISKQDFNEVFKSKQIYAHVLAVSNNGKKLLSQISKSSDIPLITSINNNTFNELTIIQRKMLELDILSSNIYSTITNDTINKDYTNKL